MLGHKKFSNATSDKMVKNLLMLISPYSENSKGISKSNLKFMWLST